MTSIRLMLLLSFSLSAFITHAADLKLQDPTKPIVYTSNKTNKKMMTSFTLSEIRITPKHKQAVINGKRLSVGNKIANYQLKKIEVGYVILVNAKGNLRLNLINSRVIRKSL